MLKKLLVSIAAVVVAFILVVSIQPAEFHIHRSLAIAAPPGAVFAKVNDFHSWEDWSPWAKIDPLAKTSYSGSPLGVGAEFSWAGNDEVGEGKMTILDSTPNDLIRIKLDFVKPFEATNTAEFTFKAEGLTTVVTWSMFGKNNFISKAVSLFLNCDKMVGGQFEKGLAQLKSLVENQPN